jgi:hypothetical protein
MRLIRLIKKCIEIASRERQDPSAAAYEMANKRFDPRRPQSILAAEESLDKGTGKRLRAEGFAGIRHAIFAALPVTPKNASACCVRSLRCKGGAERWPRPTVSMDVSQ